MDFSQIMTVVILIVYSVFYHHSQMDFSQIMNDFTCIFSFLVILILIVYGVFYHHSQMDFSQIMNNFACSVFIVFAFFGTSQWIYSSICFDVFFMLTLMDSFVFFANTRMTFTLAIASLFKTCRMSFTATYVFFLW